MLHLIFSSKAMHDVVKVAQKEDILILLFQHDHGMVVCKELSMDSERVIDADELASLMIASSLCRSWY